MTEPNRAAPGSVVAGFDGSEDARFAALWAAGEAANRGRNLVLVDVIRWPVTGQALTPGPPLPPVEPPGVDDAARERAEGGLLRVVEEAGEFWPNLNVETRVEVGRPAEILAWVAVEAELLVIGSSGHTALPRMLLGSTAAELVHTYERPIVVVRHGKELAGLPAPPDGGRIVVGVDGSSNNARAIAFAYDFAARHRCELVAVHAWSDLPMDALEPVRTWDEDWRQVRENGERLLDKSLAGYPRLYPDVPTRREVTFDRPAHALLEHAEDAALLVVGSHGRGALRSVLLGSVSHAMIYHAPCPVAVVRGE